MAIRVKGKKKAGKSAEQADKSANASTSSPARRQLFATIETRSGPCTAEIESVDLTGCAIAFPLQNEPPALAMGRKVTVAFSSDRLKRNTTLDAIVAGRRDQQGARVYSLQFHARPAQNVEDIFSIVNRRRAFRAPASHATPVSLLISEEDANVTPVQAQLGDISATGIGLLVSPDVEIELASAHWAQLEFQLPEVTEVLLLEAHIQYRVIMPSKLIRYGCAFDPDQPRFLRKQDRVIDYVMKHQQNTLKYRG